MARSTSDAVDTIGGYTITRHEPLERLEGAYLELEHKRTGARHIHIECSDDNNGFAVFFPTPPSDSTGVAHILEHVVLAGSQRFPVRAPFFSMTRRSLATFMNALTVSDWTMFLFSTRNAKDVRNITCKQLRRFHGRDYHPSNVRFCTYGDQSLETTLEVIVRAALSRFQRIEVDSAIPTDTRLMRPAAATEPYPAAAGDD